MLFKLLCKEFFRRVFVYGEVPLVKHCGLSVGKGKSEQGIVYIVFTFNCLYGNLAVIGRIKDGYKPLLPHRVYVIRTTERSRGL